MRSIFSEILIKTPRRVRYGVSIVSSISDWTSVAVITTLYILSRYNASRLPAPNSNVYVSMLRPWETWVNTTQQ